MVPTEPVASLIEPSGDLWPFSLQTLRAANVALWRMTVFNQFVRQQTEFNTLHAVEMPRVGHGHLNQIAEAGFKISTNLHQGESYDGDWYRELKRAVTRDIAEFWVLLGKPTPKHPIRRCLNCMRGDPHLGIPVLWGTCLP